MENYVDALIPFLIGAMLIEFFVCLVWRKGYYHLPNALTDLNTALLAQTMGVLWGVVLVSVYALIEQNCRIQLWAGLPEIPYDSPVKQSDGGWQLLWGQAFIWLIALLALDFCQYWNHRLSHEVNVLWGLHITHHSSADFNLSVAVRQGFLQELVNWLFYLPLALIGVRWPMFAVCFAVQFMWVYLVHTRLIGKLGWLEWVFNTPSHHRVHHGSNPQYLDKNYSSGVFILWDRVFGTFEVETAEPNYGVTVPVYSYDTLFLNVHHLIDLYRLSKQTRGFGQKLRVWFGKPGWKPTGIAQLPHDSGQPAFPKVSTERLVYILVNFLITALVGLYLLGQLFGYNPLQIVLIVAGFAFNLFALSLLMEQSRRAVWVECVRFIVTAILFLIFINEMPLF